VAIAVACLLAVATLTSVGEARGRLAQRNAAADAAALTVLQFRPTFYMIAGAGANIGVQIGDEMTEKLGVPRDAALGVPETLDPEYPKKMVPAGPSRAPAR
jgi:hypothetical protein